MKTLEEKIREYLTELYGGTPKSFPPEVAERWHRDFGLMIDFYKHWLWTLNKHNQSPMP